MPARPSLFDTVTRWAAANSPAAVVAQNVAVGLIYAALTAIVLAPQLVGGLRTTPVWPANGFALAAVCLLGYRVLPGVALGATAVVIQQIPLSLALIAFLAPVGQVSVAVWILRTLQFDARLERVRDPLVLTLVAAPAGAIVSATFGTLASGAFGTLPNGNAMAFWLSWFMRAWLGIATAAPLVFAWLRARAVPLTGRRLIEAAAIVLGLLATSGLVLVVWSGPGADAPFSFLALPFVVWAGLRFGARGAAIVVALLTAVAMALAIAGLGPVAELPVPTAQAATFLFLLMAAVTGQVLAAMVAERDDALHKRVQLEELLRHSQKMEAVGRLAGGIAHDFNNLLTAILGYTDIVGHGMDPRDPRRARCRADRPCRHARGRSHAADAGVQPPRAAQGDGHRPESALSKVEPMLRRVIGEDIKLTIAPKATPPAACDVDAGQMEQVIMNLAVNARDAMPQGGRLTDRDPRTRARRGHRGRQSRSAARPARHAVGHRHRRRDVRSGARAAVRAVLHHQGRGQRNRAGAVHRLRHREAKRRPHQRDQRGRVRHDLSRHAPAGRGRGAHRRRPSVQKAARRHRAHPPA